MNISFLNPLCFEANILKQNESNQSEYFILSIANQNEYFQIRRRFALIYLLASNRKKQIWILTLLGALPVELSIYEFTNISFLFTPQFYLFHPKKSRIMCSQLYHQDHLQPVNTASANNRGVAAAHASQDYRVYCNPLGKHFISTEENLSVLLPPPL